MSPTDPDVPDEIVGITAAAGKLKIHPDTLRRWADEGIIRSERSTTGYRLFRVGDLVAPSPAEQRRRRLAQRAS